jgi:hypothetical protein
LIAMRAIAMTIAMWSHPRSLLLASGLLLVGTAGAQTFVVDANGGPGSHFTSLPAAVAAVPDGAVLIVRSGVYQSFVLVGRGLTILGEPGARIVSNLPTTIQGVPAHRMFAMRGVDGGVGATPSRIDCHSCAGPVLVKDVAYNVLVTANQCAQLALDSCTLAASNAPAAVFSNSSVVAIECAFTTTFATTTIDMTASTLQLVRSSVSGGFAGNAITVQGGSLRVGDFCIVDVVAPTTFAVAGTAVLRRSPGILFGPCAPGITITVAPQPTIVPDASTLGGALSTVVLGPTGDVGALFVGPALSPTPIPGFVDAAWLDPNQAIPLALLPIGGWGAYSTTLPANPLLRRQLFGWQAVVLGAASGVVMTSPALWTPQ